LETCSALAVVDADMTRLVRDVWRFRDGRMAELHAFVIEARLEDGAFAQGG
jgi:ketosteroid isomerase-like protein